MPMSFVLLTRPVYTVTFADDVPPHERAYIVIDGVKRMARVDVDWLPIDVQENPAFQQWAAGNKVRLVNRSGNIETWERE